MSKAPNAWLTLLPWGSQAACTHGGQELVPGQHVATSEDCTETSSFRACSDLSLAGLRSWSYTSSDFGHTLSPNTAHKPIGQKQSWGLASSGMGEG